MTVPCTGCGELLDDEPRCPRCGTLAPPRPGASVFAGSWNDDSWNDDSWNDDARTTDEWAAPTVTGSTVDATTISEPTGGAAPWAIPIREASSPAPAPAPEPADGSSPFRAASYLVIAVAVLAGIVMLAAQVLVSDGADNDLASERTDATSAPDAGDRPADDELSDAVVGSTTTPSTVPSDSTAPPTTRAPATTSTTRATTTTTRPPTAPSSGSVPTLGSSFRSGWVAQLSSVPMSAGTASLESAWAKERESADDVVATRSDEWPSLQDGFWVLVDPGPFESEEDVRSFCGRIGRGRVECLPRMLSDRS